MWKVEYVKSVHDCESISVFSISLMIAALGLCGLDEAISARSDNVSKCFLSCQEFFLSLLTFQKCSV